MFVVSPDKVYILDKVEGNARQINGHSQYASIWLVILYFSRYGFHKWSVIGTFLHERQHL
jgi:hypothetical protein